MPSKRLSLAERASRRSTPAASPRPVHDPDVWSPPPVRPKRRSKKSSPRSSPAGAGGNEAAKSPAALWRNPSARPRGSHERAAWDEEPEPEPEPAPSAPLSAFGSELERLQRVQRQPAAAAAPVERADEQRREEQPPPAATAPADEPDDFADMEALAALSPVAHGERGSWDDDTVRRTFRPTVGRRRRERMHAAGMLRRVCSTWRSAAREARVRRHVSTQRSLQSVLQQKEKELAATVGALERSVTVSQKQMALSAARLEETINASAGESTALIARVAELEETLQAQPSEAVLTAALEDAKAEAQRATRASEVAAAKMRTAQQRAVQRFVSRRDSNRLKKLVGVWRTSTEAQTRRRVAGERIAAATRRRAAGEAMGRWKLRLKRSQRHELASASSDLTAALGELTAARAKPPVDAAVRSPTDGAAQMARAIMEQADRHQRNGLLSVNEMRTFLRGGEFEAFSEWLSPPQMRNVCWAQYDWDKDGALDMNELQAAVVQYLRESPQESSVVAAPTVRAAAPDSERAAALARLQNEAQQLSALREREKERESELAARRAEVLAASASMLAEREARRRQALGSALARRRLRALQRVHRMWVARTLLLRRRRQSLVRCAARRQHFKVLRSFGTWVTATWRSARHRHSQVRGPVHGLLFPRLSWFCGEQERAAAEEQASFARVSATSQTDKSVWR